MTKAASCTDFARKAFSYGRFIFEGLHKPYAYSELKKAEEEWTDYLKYAIIHIVPSIINGLSIAMICLFHVKGFTRTGQKWGAPIKLKSTFKLNRVIIFNIMRQSGIIPKYSAAEAANIQFVRFSTFTKDELVTRFSFRKNGQSQKSPKLDSTMLMEQSLPREVLISPSSSQRSQIRSVYPWPGLLNLRIIKIMSRTLRAHQAIRARLSLWLHGVRLKDLEVHLPQLFEIENFTGKSWMIQNDQQI